MVLDMAVLVVLAVSAAGIIVIRISMACLVIIDALTQCWPCPKQNKTTVLTVYV